MIFYHNSTTNDEREGETGLHKSPDPLININKNI